MSQDTYIQRVQLKGYKSIRDLDISFERGLNIIIGANGSGKTNFFEFLNAAFATDFKTLFKERKFEVVITASPCNINFSGSFNGFSKKESAYQATLTMLGHVFRKHINQTTHYLLDNTLKVIDYKYTSEYRLFTLTKFQFTRYLTFKNPLEAIFKNKIDIDIVSREVLFSNDEYGKVWSSRGQTNSFIDYIFNIDEMNVNDGVTLEELLADITNDKFFEFGDLIENLKAYSPIKNLKLDWQLTRQINDDSNDEKFSITEIQGIDFQYFVDGQWLNWTQLSDGTKRLFYLIGSVTYADNMDIVLIEEPEIGVHPHQLAKLMNFLKEQSLSKQIIITTHSPQVLNCLKENELNKIIIARHEGKAGTKMSHLSEEEMKTISNYMQTEAFVGDYWTLLGFEKDELNESV